MKTEPLCLPAIRGMMGNWTYYSSVMPVSEMANRIHYADELHTNRGLSEMIQRKLSGKRAKEICAYLTQRQDRFFNSLVIAFYDGPPTWYSGTVTPSPSTESDDSFDIEDIRESGSQLGVLKLSGSEGLFALDGQHRLSGIKQAFKEKMLPKNDSVPVIFVAHSNTKEGIRRSREIFTTLNKEAKKVGVGDIIALDENDPAAIVTRMLVEETSLFSGKKIAYKQTESINPGSDKESITTIANIYYSSINLFRCFYYDGKSIKQIASLPRPSDEELRELFNIAKKFFGLLGRHFPEFGEALRASAGTAGIIDRYRTENGGHLLFRPVGVTIVTNLVCQAKQSAPKLSLERCVRKVAGIPVNLDRAPFKNVLWDSRTRTMRPKGKKVIIGVLSDKIGLPQGNGHQRLIDEYMELTGTKYS